MLDKIVDQIADRVLDKMCARRQPVHVKRTTTTPIWRLIAADARAAERRTG
jgi:S-adenosylmethionine synthetase